MIKLYIGYHKYFLEGKNIYYLEDTVKVRACFSYSIKRLISKYKNEKYSIFHRDVIKYNYIIKEYNSIEELEYEYIEELI